MAHCHPLLLKHKEDKKNQEKGGNLLSSSHSEFSLLAPTSTFLFQTLSPDIFFFSSKRKKKTIKRKKMQRREGAFFQAPTLPSHFWLSLLPPHFCPFVSNMFS
jgi:hypothetical protein